MSKTTAFFRTELRETDGKPRLHGVLIAEGRAATGGRAEVFAPGSVVWPDEGVQIKIGHGGPAVAMAHPARHPSGEIRISAPATPAMVEAVEAGRDGLSVEFLALKEEQTAGGVREIRRALVDAAALVSWPEYSQARAELRGKKGKRYLWL